MITAVPYVFVATADSSGMPHMAIGEQVKPDGDSHLVFENWFCPTTLENIAVNTRISVVAAVTETGKGFQLIGSVVNSTNAAILNGYDPVRDRKDMPQVLTRFTVKVEKVLEFTGGIHTDIPISR